MTKQTLDVYISDNCKECEQLIDFLDKNQMSYEIKNISNTKEHLKELQANQVYATPAVKIPSGKFLLGFQKEHLIKVLGLR
ncbi:glutaredoxin family protein [Gracilibacillus marinus]|jgi:glutaredoxin-like protein NrdH|uniref:Glutaredoxin family protein n=1 Tax=Gracilibacillus marinus TaxID=630535 RepID=A0ABV8VUG9_9BACI